MKKKSIRIKKERDDIQLGENPDSIILLLIIIN